MEFSPAELIDKMTILKLKIDSMDLVKEYNEYEEFLNKFKEDGIIIKPEWFDQLLKANKEQWDMYSELNEIKNTTKDLEKIGRLYIAVEKSNKKRVALKNQIINETGEGCRDVKMN